MSIRKLRGLTGNFQIRKLACMVAADVALCATGSPGVNSKWEMLRMISEGHLVAIFHSVHRVLKAEKILKQKQLNFRLIPAPSQIASDCGLALSFASESLADIESALAAEGVTIVELWRMEAGEYDQIK